VRARFFAAVLCCFLCLRFRYKAQFAASIPSMIPFSRAKGTVRGLNPAVAKHSFRRTPGPPRQAGGVMRVLSRSAIFFPKGPQGMPHNATWPSAVDHPG
jgi:hypothetical protein